MRLLCYGDSNTYGYDPRSYLGGRYPADIRWTGRLGQEYDVRNAGENGRRIPQTDAEFSAVHSLIKSSAPLDGFLVMLGTNDLLCSASAETAAARMERFWEALFPAFQNTLALLIAPPPLRSGAWVTGPQQIEQSVRFGVLCGALAGRRKIPFADAGAWNVELTFDGVHFSAEGHRAFACGLQTALNGLFRQTEIE